MCGGTCVPTCGIEIRSGRVPRRKWKGGSVVVNGMASFLGEKLAARRHEGGRGFVVRDVATIGGPHLSADTDSIDGGSAMAREHMRRKHVGGAEPLQRNVRRVEHNEVRPLAHCKAPDGASRCLCAAPHRSERERGRDITMR